jgi:hypothetical protein
MQGLKGGYGIWFGLLTLGLASLPNHAMAQALPACQPPRSEEFLLLVPQQTVPQQTETQAQLQRLLPSNAILTPCNYLNTNVVRVEGFASADIAAAWAQYLADAAGLQAYVARPATNSVAAAPIPNAGGTSSPVSNAANATASNSANSTAAYNPQALGNGFAVVVNFFNKPEVATSVRQITTRDVGLVAFEQQPYLLASHTTDAAAAANLLRTLSERGLTAAIVDSRRAVLLTPAVK